ncbi:MAG: tetratricopeptide repeat protein [Deltaproteobacteria bacterium]|nr:tetratricopeptide repeat protein [Deltaproteobacteria bacterium]
MLVKLGQYDTALQYLHNSLAIDSHRVASGQGPCTALQYLHNSLAIRRDIGDKAGMIPALHNMCHIFMQTEKPEEALQHWSQALNLAHDICNAEGIFRVAGTLGRFLAQHGDRRQAAEVLEETLQVGCQAGFPGTDDLAALLAQIQS